jgi:hypothetical protein
MKKYISFLGFIQSPSNLETLEKQYPLSEDGFCAALKYEQIDQKDSLLIFLAKIDINTGHLVADFPDQRNESAFVLLNKDGMPLKSNDNFNPNPVPQLCE